jgi:hypothetical protein
MLHLQNSAQKPFGQRPISRVNRGTAPFEVVIPGHACLHAACEKAKSQTQQDKKETSGKQGLRHKVKSADKSDQKRIGQFHSDFAL